MIFFPRALARLRFHQVDSPMNISLDYTLNKLFHDLHTTPALADDYRRDRPAVLAGYALSERVRAAVLGDDIVALAHRTNPFLLRYYCFLIGMTDHEFIDMLRPLRSPPFTSEALTHG